MTAARPGIAALAFLIAPATLLAQGQPLGPEFRVNTYTTSYQRNPAVAAAPTGDFVVVWQGNLRDGSQEGVFAQRYDSGGAPLGGEFRVNTYTLSKQSYAAVATDSAGNFVVAWDSYSQDGSNAGIFAQRFASSGSPLGGEFQVNTLTTSVQDFAAVAADAAGNFVIVWQGTDTGSPLDPGVFAQRYANTGVPLGGEFRVNGYTTGAQMLASVASDSAGNFMVVWRSSVTPSGGHDGVFGQGYDNAGAPSGRNSGSTPPPRVPRPTPQWHPMRPGSLSSSGIVARATAALSASSGSATA